MYAWLYAVFCIYIFCRWPEVVKTQIFTSTIFSRYFSDGYACVCVRSLAAAFFSNHIFFSCIISFCELRLRTVSYFSTCSTFFRWTFLLTNSPCINTIKIYNRTSREWMLPNQMCTYKYIYNFVRSSSRIMNMKIGFALAEGMPFCDFVLLMFVCLLLMLRLVGLTNATDNIWRLNNRYTRMTKSGLYFNAQYQFFFPFFHFVDWRGTLVARGSLSQAYSKNEFILFSYSIECASADR